MNKYKRNQKTASNRIFITPPIMLFVMSIFMFAVTQLVYLSLFGVRGQELSQIQRDKSTISSEINSLGNKINEYKSVPHIYRQATESLGLIENKDVRVIENSEKYGSNIVTNQ